MKKIIISILTISFLILSGCYKGDDTVTVKINLQNLHAVKSVQPGTFLDKIRSFFIRDAYAADQTLYVAALKDNKPLVVLVDPVAYNSFPADVEMEVPAGDNITFVVLYDFDGFTSGKAVADLKAGEETNITINRSSFSANFSYFSNLHTCSWDSIPGATKYILEGEDSYSYQWIVIDEGLFTSHNVPSSGYNTFRVKIIFDFFNLVITEY